MKEPDPPDDLDRTILETFDEMNPAMDLPPPVLEGLSLRLWIYQFYRRRWRFLRLHLYIPKTMQVSDDQPTQPSEKRHSKEARPELFKTLAPTFVLNRQFIPVGRW